MSILELVTGLETAPGRDDLGQIEVLRGPQGTLRGRAASSGSIAMTTRRPDLSEFGGSVNTTNTNQDGSNAHAAVNLPLVSDRLALRVAGLFDENNYDEVRSIDNSSNPNQRTKSGRATLLWEVTDSVTATMMYQYLDRTLHSFDAYQSFHLAELSAPVVDTAADPEIAARDRLGITDGARDASRNMDIVTAQGKCWSWVTARQRPTTNGSCPRLLRPRKDRVWPVHT